MFHLGYDTAYLSVKISLSLIPELVGFSGHLQEMVNEKI